MSGAGRSLPCHAMHHDTPCHAMQCAMRCVMHLEGRLLVVVEVGAREWVVVMRLPILLRGRPPLHLRLQRHLGIVPLAVSVREHIKVARQVGGRLQPGLGVLSVVHVGPQLRRGVVVLRQRQVAHDVELVARVERVAEGGLRRVLRRRRVRPRRLRRRRSRRDLRVAPAQPAALVAHV
eukprot:scaffold7226_cov55-Phaeocystis_antarctica.AAC.1